MPSTLKEIRERDLVSQSYTHQHFQQDTALVICEQDRRYLLQLVGRMRVQIETYNTFCRPVFNQEFNDKTAALLSETEES